MPPRGPIVLPDLVLRRNVINNAIHIARDLHCNRDPTCLPRTVVPRHASVVAYVQTPQLSVLRTAARQAVETDRTHDVEMGTAKEPDRYPENLKLGSVASP
jgi:hypothetical protein